MSYKDKIKERKLAALTPSVIAEVVNDVVREALGRFDVPEPGKVWGPDISHWTGLMDMAKLKEAGASFVIIKFMDGKLISNYAVANYRRAIEAGILVGPYQWLRSAKEGPWYSPAGQAREYLSMLRDHPVDIRPSIDYESSPRGKRYNADQDDLWSYRVMFREGYGAEPMVYSSQGYAKGLGESWLDCPFWQAHYGGPPLSVPPWGTRWDFFQWTEGGDGVKYGSLPSGERSMDLNYWRGSLAELYQFCGKELPA